MTIGKLLLKRVALVLVVALLLPLASSCGASQNEPPFELIGNDSEELYESLRIVVSATCSSELFSAAQDFAQKLTKQTGLPCKIVYDSENPSQESGVLEILLGNTDRAASKKAMRDLRTNDYLCKLEDGVLLLGGRSDKATSDALGRFYKEILPHATPTAILPSEGGFLSRAKYTVNAIRVGGFDLACFDIVCDASPSEQMLLLAKTMQSTVEQTVFYSLSLQASGNCYEGEKRIFLTLSNEETDTVAHIRFDDQGVTLSAKTLFGLSCAAKRFCELLVSADASFGAANTVKAVNYEQTALTLTSVLIRPNEDPLAEVIAMSDLVKTNPTDLVFATNFSEGQYDLLFNNLSSEYNATEGVELLSKASACQRISSPAEDCNLYRIGSETEGFLILTTANAPSKELLDSIESKALPLLIILSAEGSDIPWESDAFDRVIFNTAENASFSIWTEPSCFLVHQTVAQNGYTSYTVERTSAFYRN